MYVQRSITTQLAWTFTNKSTQEFWNINEKQRQAFDEKMSPNSKAVKGGQCSEPYLNMKKAVVRQWGPKMKQN